MNDVSRDGLRSKVVEHRGHPADVARSAHAPGPRDPHPVGPFQSNGRDITAAQFYWEMFNDALAERDGAQAECDRLAALNAELLAALGLAQRAILGQRTTGEAMVAISAAIAKARSES